MRNLVTLFVVVFSLNCLTIFAQEEHKNPDRGYPSGASYSISDIESINTTNGNLVLNIPLVGLPKGRGSVGQSIGLTYNSKLYDTSVEELLNSSGELKDQNTLVDSEDGGWKYSTNHYALSVKGRFDTAPSIPCDGTAGQLGKNAYIWKVQMTMPDGSRKEFRPTGYSDQYDDGFFNVSPNGYQMHACPTGGNPSSTLITTGGMVYYSTDGSFIKLVVDHVSGGDVRGENNPWTMYLPDGGRVTGGIGLLTRTYDRNNNYIEGFTDAFGRSVTLQLNAAADEDHVKMTGANNEELVWKVKWKNISSGMAYTTTAAMSGREKGGTSNQTTSMSFRVVDRITLPTQLGGLYYEFHYNSESNPNAGWGELSGIKLPSGAETAYQYTTPIPVNTGNVLLRYVSQKTLTYLAEYDGTSTSVSDTWTYNIGKTQSAITDPSGAVTTEYHGNTSYQHTMSGLVYKVVKPDGSISEKIWAFNRPTGANSTAAINPYVKTELSTVANATGIPALTAIRDYTFDANGNPTEVKEYDWVAYGSVHDGNGNITGIPGGAELKRTTATSYYNSPTSNSANAYWSASSPNVRNAVARTEIVGANATEIIYDNPLTTANPIEVRTWDSTKNAISTPLTPGNSIVTTTQYDSYGNVTLTTDGNGNLTQIVYGAVNGFTGLYPTETRTAYGTAIQQTELEEYDFKTGLVTRTTTLGNTANENLINETEYDAVSRPTKVKNAVGTPLEIWSTTEYDDTLRRVIVRSDIETKGDGKKIGVQHYDQLGRVRLTRQIENVLTEDPANETHGIKTQTHYLTVPNVGEYELTSNPYRAATSSQATDEPTMGWKVEFESKAGDVSTSETFSGVTMPAPWGYNSNSTGIGKEEEDTTATITTDERGKKRRTISDALGRLIRVDEPNENNDLGPLNSPTQATFFTHDTLGNLTQIVQGEQTRVFTYSSLSRLTSSSNPESGTFLFVYDNSGNLISKTDAGNVSTTYTYDALNRAVFRNYSDDTPDISYVYDDLTVPFSKGKLTKISSAVAETRYSAFDAANRVVSSRQVIDGNNYDFGYTYYLGGSLKTQTYPSGKIVKFEYSSDDEMAQVSNQLTGKVYANSFAYSAHGQVEKMRLGNGRWETTRFNGALQVTEIGLGYSAVDTGLWKTNYEYGDWESGALNQQKNNGNLARQTVSVPTIGQAVGFTAVQTYSYDNLDRLKSAEETVGGSPKWKQTFLYDRYTNRNLDTANTTLQSVESNIPKVVNPQILTADNRYKQDQDNDGQPDFLYDESGNLTKDSQNRYFAYDAENRQKTATGNSLSMSYLYDGNGKRVKTVNAITNQTTIFVYDTDGDLAAEYAINVPAPQNPTVSYLTEDALGSVRVTTNSFGDVQARRDFLPFGEELHAGIGNRTSNQKYSSDADDTRKKFATYQRDSETKLDFAQSRYYSPTQGRFTSPDEFKGGPDELFDFEEDASDNPTFYADLENPQSLNKYQYTYNNPYKYNDPNGHCPFCGVFAVRPIVGPGPPPTVIFGRTPPIVESVIRIVGQAETVIGARKPPIPNAVPGRGAAQARVPTPRQAVPRSTPTSKPRAAPKPNAKRASKPQTPGSRPYKSFTRKGKDIVKGDNAKKNGGRSRCEDCGVRTTKPKRIPKGGKRPKTETNVDHIVPRSRGGSGTPENGAVRCFGCNIKKGAN